ncbi:hypothetical protein KJ713_01090 [Patescibacteria group bacterium]|nr:hypothetical protein [Patescibacteria group bacterium]
MQIKGIDGKAKKEFFAAMKKLIFVIIIYLFLFPLGALAKNSCSSCQGSLAAAERGGSKSEGQTQTQSPSQSAGQAPTQRQEEGQGPGEVDQELENNKPSYNPRSETARAHMNEVAKAVEQLILISYQLENQGLGSQIREIARNQSDDEDKATQALDNAQGRGAILKFFLGANYKELKEIKKVLEQNQQRINKLNRIRGQISNEGENADLENQIKVLAEQNTTLQAQANDLTSGFSLLGWLFKIIYK